MDNGRRTIIVDLALKVRLIEWISVGNYSDDLLTRKRVSCSL